MACLSCSRDLHFECSNKVEDEGGWNCCCYNEEPAVDRSIEPRRTYKGDNVTVSAGRKRAAVEHPLERESPCEWRGLANCGGGKHPIVGCIKGKQEHRHHGPHKSTVNNHLSNIHRICTSCHNRWHAANDKEYDVELFAQTAHKPRPATVDDYMGE